MQSYIVNRIRLIQDFVWGDGWSWRQRFPEGTFYMDAVGLPDGVPAATGYYDGMFYGTASAGVATGLTPISFSAYNESYELIGSPIVYPNVHTYFRLYYGELNTLPDSESLINIRTLGLSSSLVTSSRNLNIIIPASPGTASYKVIIVPTITYGGGDVIYNFNNILLEDGNDAGFVSYAGYYVPDDTSFMYHNLFQIGPTENETNVYLRYSAYSRFPFLGPSPANTTMNYTNSVSQIDPSLYTLYKTIISGSFISSVSSWVENLDPVSHSNVTRSVTINGNLSVGQLTLSRQTYTTVSAINFGAYDGDPDYIGASGNQSTTTNKNSGIIGYIYTSSADLLQFKGTGSLPISFSATTTHSISNITNYLEIVQRSLVALMTVEYYYYYN